MSACNLRDREPVRALTLSQAQQVLKAPLGVDLSPTRCMFPLPRCAEASLLRRVTANMLLIAFGVLVCAYGELNLVVKGLILQLSALAFEVIVIKCSLYP